MPGKEEERDELNLKKRKDMARTKQHFSNIEMHSNIEQKSSKKDKFTILIKIYIKWILASTPIIIKHYNLFNFLIPFRISGNRS